MKISTARLARLLGLPNKYRHSVMHELTEDQIQTIRDSLGDGSDWPRFVADPVVSYAVDCLVSYEDPPIPFAEHKQLHDEELAEMHDLPADAGFSEIVASI